MSSLAHPYQSHQRYPVAVASISASLVSALLSLATCEYGLASDGSVAGNGSARKADTSAEWSGMFKRQVNLCWIKPHAERKSTILVAEFTIKLSRDGFLQEAPVATAPATTDRARDYHDSAFRALVACQPYKLPPVSYDEWKHFVPVFSEQGS